MRSRFIFLCALLLSALVASAQTDQALLYKVTGNGLSAPSYLYGTFHLVCPNDLVISSPAKSAFTATQQLYLELDMDDPAMMGDMQKAIMLSDGKTAKDYLSADDYKQLDSYLTSAMGMGMAQLGTIKPLGLMSVIYMSMLKCQPASYDLTFAQLAGQDKKEVLGLESLSDQLAAFDKKPLEKQYQELVELARHPAEVQSEFTSLLAAYKQHDLRKMNNLMKSSKYSGDMAELEENLLNVRNANWIPVIEQAARTKPTFFAFGAGHLMGDKGVVSLLRRKGYTVSGINEEGEPKASK